MSIANIFICPIPEIEQEEWLALHTSLASDVVPSLAESFLSAGGAPGYELPIRFRSRVGDDPDNLGTCTFLTLDGTFGQGLYSPFYHLVINSYQLLTEDDYLASMVSGQDDPTFKHY